MGLTILSRANANLEEMDEEAIAAFARANGKKLAVLLGTARLPDELKQAIAEIVPTLTVGQLDGLIGVLESDYLEQKAGVTALEAKLENDIVAVLEKADVERTQQVQSFRRRVKQMMQQGKSSAKKSV